MNGKCIESVVDFKYLGVQIESSLKFTKQLDTNINNVNHKLFLFRKLRSSIDNHTALILFKSMVLPYAEFANVFVTGCDDQRKIKLQRLLNKGLKVALRRDRLSETKLLHKEARLASWETRARLAFNKLMFKFRYNQDFLEQGRNATRLHESTVFSLEKPNSVQLANCVSYKCRKLWNDLPSSLRLLDCRETFNVLLKAHYRNLYFGAPVDGDTRWASLFILFLWNCNLVLKWYYYSQWSEFTLTALKYPCILYIGIIVILLGITILLGIDNVFVVVLVQFE